MPKRAGAHGALFAALISESNLRKAIVEVNRTHHWSPGHRGNPCTKWVELTAPDRVRDLRDIFLAGFTPSPPRVTERYDASARKTRIICEPRQWPDQYVHHALIQVLQPLFMRRMDSCCCGSIRGRGTHYAMKRLQKWMRSDYRGTRYCLTCDIRHFYDSLTPAVVMDRMRHLIKDGKVLELIDRIVSDGVRIGYYTSQWFANTTLQPLDELIRNHPGTRHYLRYMDNLTIFGASKRQLHRLRRRIAAWLTAHDLSLKSNWQVYRTEAPAKVKELGAGRGSTPPVRLTPDILPCEGRQKSLDSNHFSDGGMHSDATSQEERAACEPIASPHRGGADRREAAGLGPHTLPLPPPRLGVPRPRRRLPDAVGYRYGRGYTLPRKYNLLRIKRKLARVRRRISRGLQPTFRQAAGLLSRLGQLVHCNNMHLYAYLLRPGERIQRTLKTIVRAYTRKELSFTWSMYLASANPPITRPS